MKYFFLTGDPSGDRIGAMIAEYLLAQGAADIVGWGSKYAVAAGVRVLRDTDDLAVMGYKEVIRKLFFFNRLLGHAKADIETENPDVVVLVDYGSFNLRIAKWASKGGRRIVFLSPPKMWASRSGRIKILRRYCDKVIVLFPFEKEYYLSRGLPVEYYGHPFASSAMLETHAPKSTSINKRIALLPGSRVQEIQHILPVMIEALVDDLNFSITISKAPNIQSSLILAHVPPALKGRVTISDQAIADLLAKVDLALVTSGTATMEAALADVPQVVCYKTSGITYAIAKQIIQVKYISLVNLILDKEVVTELIQHDCNPSNIRKALRSLEVEGRKNSMLSDYSKIKTQLSQPNTIEFIAQAISRAVD